MANHPFQTLAILLATRARPKLVERFFQSVIDTAVHPEWIKIVLYIDEDDTQSHRLDHPHLKLKKIIGPKAPMGVMHNKCYAETSEDIIMITGDDNVFRSRGWDDRVRESMNQVGDGISLVFGNDLLQGHRMCTSPFLSRTYCELLDGPCPDDYTAEFVDTHILDIFYKLRYWGHDRIFYLSDMVIEHMHYVAGKAELDDTYANKAPTEENRELFFHLDPLRVAHAKKLVEYITKQSTGG